MPSPDVSIPESTDPNEIEYQTLIYAPPSYAPLRQKDRGEYKFIVDDNDPTHVVGIVWTNYKDGLGVISTTTGEGEVALAQRLTTDFASSNVPANVAYLMLDTFITTTSGRVGLLSQVVDAAKQLENSTAIPPEPEEDGWIEDE